MNEHTLSQRLERVAAHIPAGARLADIGSDHAYLPVALMRRGAIAAAVAGEVAATPFQAANRTVADNGLTQHITVRLADGLAAIEAGDDITAVSLCGMGGETIRDILDSGKAHLNGRERLILQPNGGEQPLRQWLVENGYQILHEDLLRENRFYYEIIVAERAEAMTYTADAWESPLHSCTLLVQVRPSARARLHSVSFHGTLSPSGICICCVLRAYSTCCRSWAKSMVVR